LLRTVLEAVVEFEASPIAADTLSAGLQADVSRHDIQPLFVPGMEGI
jgi:hypothetical protein